MTPTIFAAILLAALLHALWNALAKRQAEGRVSVLLVSLCSGLFAAPFLPLVGWPVAAEYPWLALSILLHCGYCLFLGRAYRLGEFGQIYPLARGSAPLVTLLFGALLLGEVTFIFGSIRIVDDSSTIRVDDQGVGQALVHVDALGIDAVGDRTTSLADVEREVLNST